MNETLWNGYKQKLFTVGGRTSYIVCPENPLPGNPWVWRTEFFEAFNYADRALLERGWHLAYHCVSDMYGCPESIKMMKEFYDVAVNEYEMNSKPALFGFSRGALYAVNFALRYPDCCGLLYLDAPVLDIRSWPGGLGTGFGEESCWEECKAIYHLDDESAKNFSDNPLDHTDELAKTGIPVILVCGDADRYVPYTENGEPFYKRMMKAGANIEQIVKPGCDHHPHSLSDPAPIVEYIEKNKLSGIQNTNKLARYSGKKAVFYGDSITYGAYTGENDSCPASLVEKPWCNIVGERLGLPEITNYSESGISVSSTSSVRPEASVSGNYMKMRDDADLIFIAAGTNDFGTEVAEGSCSDTTDVSFTGALRVLCSGLRKKYPAGEIFYITPIDRFDRVGKNGLLLERYREIINKIAGDEFGFKIINGGAFGFTASDPAFIKKYMKDGVHPNSEGHKIYADGVIKALSELI